MVLAPVCSAESMCDMCWAASTLFQYLGAFRILTVSLSRSRELHLFLHLLNLLLSSLFLSPKLNNKKKT